MSGKNRKNEDPVVKHPSIVDIHVKHIETLVNFTLKPKQIQKRKVVEKADLDKQPQGDDGAEASGEKS